MKTRIETLVLGTALASILAVTVVGCGKTTDSSGVAPPSTTVGTDIDDSVITSNVKAALLGDPNIKSLDIAVVTRDDEVLLSGFVDNQAQMDRAVTLARAVEGVRLVNNEMSVKK